MRAATDILFAFSLSGRLVPMLSFGFDPMYAAGIATIGLLELTDAFMWSKTAMLT
jgi:hypothetical protein